MLFESAFFASANFDMLGHGSGVSHYSQFFDQRLEKYQLLSCPYLGSFEGNNG